MIIKNYLKNPIKYTVLGLSSHNLLNWMPDKMYLKLRFRIKLEKRLNLQNPKTFNEKLQWLKLYNRKPIYTNMVDKYEVKKLVANIIGNDYIIPTLGVWDRFEDIDFGKLPEQFVLKTTHDSGGIIICSDKRDFDIENARKKINNWLERDYYKRGREWPYKDVKRRIIAEKYMVDESGTDLKDYKIFCFNGEPKLIQLDFDRFRDHKRNLYTIDWQKIDADFVYSGDSERFITPPVALTKMLELSKKVSAGNSFIRTDFYVINEKIYFGELTFFPESGFGKFSRDVIDIELGKLIELPQN